MHVFTDTALAQLIPVRLECEYRTDPLGIDELRPRLSWQLSDVDGRGRQTAYRILVSGSMENLLADRGDLWDSGKINSQGTSNILYRGRRLEAFRECYWKVRVWDETGKGSGWSEPAFFSVGPMDELDWSADWISSAKDEDESNFPWLRRVFNLDVKPRKAYAYINVHGYFELYVNGKKVGEDVLSPSVSDYSRQSLYVTYDITPYLKEGENVVGLWIAHGWYRRDVIEYFGVTEDRPVARARFEFKGMAGDSWFLATDRTWEYRLSNRSYAGTWWWGHFGGEAVRTGEEDPGWSRIEDTGPHWKQVDNYTLPMVPVVAQRDLQTRIIDTLPVAKMESLGKKEFLVDFGRHINGWIDLRFYGATADGQVVIDYIDKLLPQGTDRDPIEQNFAIKLEGDPAGRSMVGYHQQDLLYLANRAAGHFRNRFNYHAFRWVRIKGIEKISEGDLKALMISENITQVTDFECSNPLLNQIWSTVNHTYRCIAYNGYVVDCPHRERVGYGGDSHSSLETALSNFDMAALCNKWTVDWNRGNYATGMWSHSAPEIPQHKNKFSPGWGGFGLFLPWQFYVYYGDTVNLSRAYPCIRRWMEYLHSNTGEGILHADTARGFSDRWSFHGDWVAPPYGMQPDRRVDTRSTQLFNNCYYLYNLDLAARIADLLNRPEDARTYRCRMAYSQKAIHQRFFNPSTRDYANGEQPYQAFPLYVGLVPPEMREEMDRHLAYLILDKNKGHLNTGMLGTYFMLEYLMETGRNDLIYTMVNQKTYPGWGYMIGQGATTIWEQWNGQNSQIHNCYLSIGKWFVQGLGGIRPDEENPGFSHFYVVPGLLKVLDYVQVIFRTRNGMIVSNWKQEEGHFTCEVQVPVNTTATFVLPWTGIKQVKHNQEKVDEFSVSEKYRGPCLELSSGTHVIDIEPDRRVDGNKIHDEKSDSL
jgi:alpha-L-rhamnosidase